MAFPPVALPKSGLSTQQLGDLIVSTMFGAVLQASPEDIIDGTGDDVRFWTPANIGGYLTAHGVTPDQLEALATEVANRPTAEDVNTELTALSTYVDGLFTAAHSGGEMGWKILASVGMAGVATVDLTGIPAEANEVIIRVQGMSTNTGTVNLAGQFLDSVGAVISSNTYYGYVSTLAASAASGLAWSGVGYASHMTSMPAANFTSGIIRMVRMHPTGVWSVTSHFNDGTRQCVSSGIKDSMQDCRGYRLGVVGANFDAGTCGVAWRR